MMRMALQALHVGDASFALKNVQEGQFQPAPLAAGALLIVFALLLRFSFCTGLPPDVLVVVVVLVVVLGLGAHSGW
jgi:hypothetical protein